MFSFISVLSLVIVLASTAPTTPSFTTGPRSSRQSDPQDSYNASFHSLGALDEDVVPLRILPLGASITWGQGSSDGNGYRNYLREFLTRTGASVDMVGNVHSGTMEDNVRTIADPRLRLDSAGN